jgi:glycosyltransferase involved in cell wall biosynthesis
MSTLLIVPCYNEQENILNLYNEIRDKTDYDCVFVNDASTDESLCIMREHGIPHINLALNLGIGGAMQAGYRYALREGYDVAVQVDGDGQHDPTYIEMIVGPVADGSADMVIGSRYIEKQGFQSSMARRAGIRLFRALIKLLSGRTITDATSGFRAMNRNALKLFDKFYAKDYPEPDSTMFAIRNGLKVTESPVVMRERQGGQSSIRPLSALYYMIKVPIGIVLARLSEKARVG